MGELPPCGQHARVMLPGDHGCDRQHRGECAEVLTTNLASVVPRVHVGGVDADAVNAPIMRHRVAEHCTEGHVWLHARARPHQNERPQGSTPSMQRRVRRCIRAHRFNGPSKPTAIEVARAAGLKSWQREDLSRENVRRENSDTPAAASAAGQRYHHDGFLKRRCLVHVQLAQDDAPSNAREHQRKSLSTTTRASDALEIESAQLDLLGIRRVRDRNRDRHHLT